jgi:outer membrane receptor for ferrienterochelin and colicins
MRNQLSVFFLFTFLLTTQLYAQNEFRAIVQDSSSKEPLIGVNVYLKNTVQGAVTGIDGVVDIKDIPDGTHILVFSSVGYQKKEIA